MTRVKRVPRERALGGLRMQRGDCKAAATGELPTNATLTGRRTAQCRPGRPEGCARVERARRRGAAGRRKPVESGTRAAGGREPVAAVNPEPEPTDGIDGALCRTRAPYWSGRPPPACERFKKHQPKH